jgi:hypothetical protein
LWVERVAVQNLRTAVAAYIVLGVVAGLIEGCIWRRLRRPQRCGEAIPRQGAFVAIEVVSDVLTVMAIIPGSRGNQAR